jgi:DNA-directed RNA polymerase sigma subunit (sigma70/sigma32)
MSDKPQIDAEPEPEWWRRLPEDEKVILRRVLGENWRPSENAEKDVARAFDVTRQRIREIEQRALQKLRRDDGK